MNTNKGAVSMDLTLVCHRVLALKVSQNTLGVALHRDQRVNMVSKRTILEAVGTKYRTIAYELQTVLFSHSVMSNFLQPHNLQ